MLTFLSINGYRVVLPNEIDLADKIVDLTEKVINYKSLSVWLKPFVYKV